MSDDRFTTPTHTARSHASSSSRFGSTKRDSLQAELDRDPQLSTAKRQQRSQALDSHMSKSSLERQLVAATVAKADLEGKLREKDKQIERLERDRLWLAEREQAEREEKEAERQQANELQKEAEAKLRTLRTSHATLTAEHADLKEEHAALSRTTAQTVSSQKSQITLLTKQVATLNDELEEAKRVADQRSRTLVAVQEQLEDLTISHGSRQPENEDWRIVREELQRTHQHLSELERTSLRQKKELEVLREKRQAVGVLEEQKRGLELKLRAADELRTKVAMLEEEVEAGRREREQWARTTDAGSSSSNTPVSVTQQLRTLRDEHARLAQEKGVVAATLKEREIELTNTAHHAKEAAARAEALDQQVSALRDKLKRRGQRTQIAEEENRFLKALTASYSGEAALNNIDVDEVLSRRIRDLEILLEQFKTNNAALEREILDLGGDPLNLGECTRRADLITALEHERTAHLESRESLKEAEGAIEKHLEKIDELEQTLHDLQGDIAAGNHVPPHRRVLSMRDNPAQQWEDLSRAAMAQLKSENEALLQRLKDLEESGVRDGGVVQGEGELVPRTLFEGAKQEKDELAAMVEQKDKRILRLKQVFEAKSAEFREATAAILGVKLAFYPNGQVRVTSLYDLSATFVFQPEKSQPTSAGMQMQLVAQGEEVPPEVEQIMRYWVSEEQCMPGFMASITLEMYDKKKREERLVGGVTNEN